MGQPMESTSPRDTLNGPSGPRCKLARQTKNHLTVTVGDIMRRYGDVTVHPLTYVAGKFACGSIGAS